jgi:hypothetical protein
MLESAKPPPSLIVKGTNPLMIKDGGKNKAICSPLPQRAFRECCSKDLSKKGYRKVSAGGSLQRALQQGR